MQIDWLLGEDLWAWGCGSSSPHVRLAYFATTEHIYIILRYVTMLHLVIRELGLQRVQLRCKLY